MHRLSDVDLRLLRIFKAIVEAGGLVGAQLTLNMAQSTVSTRLSELETRLGFRLCVRGRAGFSLTKAGQQIYESCGDLFSAADRFQNVAASISGDMKGVLRIGMVDAVISNRCWNLSAIIRDFSDRARDAVIELKVESPGEMEQALIEGGRELGIGSFFRRRLGITYLPIYKERQSIYCALDHPLAHRATPPRAEDLQRYPFVARRYLQRYDLERVGQVAPRALVENMEAQAALILSGRFIGFLPQHYAEALPAHAALHRVVTLPEVDYSSPFYVLYKDTAEENILIRSFLNRVRASQPAELGEA
jgi:DNA-binding transcriptional LysR family regulator